MPVLAPTTGNSTVDSTPNNNSTQVTFNLLETAQSSSSSNSSSLSSNPTSSSSNSTSVSSSVAQSSNNTSKSTSTNSSSASPSTVSVTGFTECNVTFGTTDNSVIQLVTIVGNTKFTYLTSGNLSVDFTPSNGFIGTNTVDIYVDNNSETSVVRDVPITSPCNPSSSSSSNSSSDLSSSTNFSNSTTSSTSVPDSSSSQTSNSLSISSSISSINSSPVDATSSSISTTSTISSNPQTTSSSNPTLSSSSNNPSSSSSSQQTSVANTYIVNFSDNQSATVQLVNVVGDPNNDNCTNLAQYSEKIINTIKTITFKANCLITKIKTIWNNLDSTKTYQFQQYDTNTNQLIPNFPATVGIEDFNGTNFVVSYHEIRDNQIGDSDSVSGSIVDPYALVLQTTNISNNNGGIRTLTLPNQNTAANSSATSSAKSTQTQQTQTNQDQSKSVNSQDNSKDNLISSKGVLTRTGGSNPVLMIPILGLILIAFRLAFRLKN